MMANYLIFKVFREALDQFCGLMAVLGPVMAR